MSKKLMNDREWEILRDMDETCQDAFEMSELEKENVKAWKVIFIAFLFLILALGISAIIQKSNSQSLMFDTNQEQSK